MNKIIIFHLDDSKNLRGGERQVLYLAKELKELGYENYIVARKNSPLYRKSIEEEIPAITLPYIFEWDLISGIILAIKINKINKNRKKVIIHTHTGHTPAVAVISRLFLKAKLIVHRRVDFKIKNNFLSKLKYKNADAIIAISSVIKKIISGFIPQEKIKLIPSSIDSKLLTELSSKIQRDNVKIIGTLIALVPHKDPENLVKAARVVLEKYPDIEFLIGGEGNLRKKVENMIIEYGISDKVKLYGYVDDNINFFKSIDIFVLPSKEEGLGSVLIEAMACGLPIVATDAGGIPELIKDNYNGIIVEKQNPNKLAEGIIKLIENPELRKKISENAKEEAKKYSSRNMVIKTLEVYEKAIKNS